MNECICSSCRNLKGVADDNGAIEEFECIYGYPSEECDTCETGECESTCSHYLSDDEQLSQITVKCSVCGKELQQVCSNDEAGSVQCIDCFLKNS